MHFIPERLCYQCHQTITKGETVDAVQHILAIAERERRKRALKEESGQTQPPQIVLDKEQTYFPREKPWTQWKK
jgi:hypothetical protein